MQDIAFQRLIFITMLAWENPYADSANKLASIDSYSLQVYSLLEIKFLFLLLFSFCADKYKLFLELKYRAG